MSNVSDRFNNPAMLAAIRQVIGTSEPLYVNYTDRPLNFAYADGEIRLVSPEKPPFFAYYPQPQAVKRDVTSPVGATLPGGTRVFKERDLIINLPRKLPLILNVVTNDVFTLPQVQKRADFVRVVSTVYTPNGRLLVTGVEATAEFWRKVYKALNK